MTCEIVIGHRGAGKSLYAVRRAREYMEAGRPVASNITIHPDKLMSWASKATYTKLPYVPRSGDLQALGYAYPESDDYNEDRFGLVILDEAGSWLNTREWQDKDRRALFQWATQSRKFGWDLLLIIQDYDALDKQIRESLVDEVVSLACLDRLGLPLVGQVLPKVHVATARYKSRQGPVSYRRWYRGRNLYKAYNTKELIRLESTLTDEGELIDARGSWTGLSAWHLKGRYRVPSRPWAEVLYAFVYALIVLSIGVPLSILTGRSPVRMLKRMVDAISTSLLSRDQFAIPESARRVC